MIEVSECVLGKPITCSFKEKISSAAKKIKKYGLRHLYVIDNKKKLVGVFSAVDFVNTVIAAGKDYRKMTVSQVMKKDITSFKKSDALTAALGFMSKKGIYSLPVVDNEKLVGVISYKDTLATLLKKQQKQA